MILSLIVAAAENDTIGKDNRLIWHLPADLKHFKSITTGHTVIMGRRTFESIGKALPNRRNIVVTHNPEFHHEGVESAPNTDDALRMVEEDGEVFVIGGATLYRALWHRADRLYMTRVHTSTDGDVRIPPIDSSEWEEMGRTEREADAQNEFACSFIEYHRVQHPTNGDQRIGTMGIVACLTAILLWGLPVTAQERTIKYEAALSGFTATENTLPFWAVSNRYGLQPDGQGGRLDAALYSDFTNKHKVSLAYGVSATGYLSDFDNNLLLDQLYVSGRWRKLRLDIGMIHRDTEYGGVSATNGNIVWSGNARTMPGYNLRSTDFIALPWVGKVLSFRFNWSDYRMIDDRYMDKVRLHNKSLFVKITPAKRIEVIVGLEHFAQWAGTSPKYGKQPSSFKDYLRIVCGKEGGEGSTASDAKNALGNHVGREHLRVNYLADNYTLAFYHDIPFEDGSGTDFRSFPDGTYCLYYGTKDQKKWITDAIFEFHYTKYQSGSRHDRPIDPEHPELGRKILGGNDNYFNNGEYASGWTNYGRTIGTPLITPCRPNENGITMGVYNSRVVGYHMGLKGHAFHRLPYRAMLTYTLNYGRYNDPLAKMPTKQFSFGLEAGMPENRHIPFHIDLGLYGDFGSLLPNNFGISLKMSRKGIL